MTTRSQMPNLVALVGAVLVLAGCSGRAPEPDAAAFRAAARAFLDAYTAEYARLDHASNLAEWDANTRIVPGDTTTAARVRAANEARAAFLGSTANIEAARRFLARAADLDPIDARQLAVVLFKAAGSPATDPETVRSRIAAEAEQNEVLYGFEFRLDGREVTTGQIDDLLKTDTDLERRLAAWEASKAIGPTLKPGLERLRDLRNRSVQGLGFDDYFAYMASEYGLTTDELTALVDQVNRDLRPLYRELHTWARHELAARYGQPVPDLLPAHWLPNRWGQDWAALVTVPGLDIEAALRTKDAEWLVRQGERFYVSLGFPPLPDSFWELSSLYPAPPGAGWRKNNHASAWHIDNERDVRCLMSVEPNAEYYETVHHELGHTYYQLAYARPEVPLLLRDGADRAYHEAVGSLMGLAALQPRFLASVGLAPEGAAPDSIRFLLREALNHVVFIPWSTGTMFQFEKALYADSLSPSEWNARWWELTARYQGIAPPSPRGEEWCDAATKTHINDDPASYYDYALSVVLLFQLHDHIARNILGEDPRNTNYYGRPEVGAFLRSLLEPGATVHGQVLLESTTGSRLTAKPMLDYFAPLYAWLREVNAGRTATLEDL
jgi:peptidyl-dipeptidase A